MTCADWVMVAATLIACGIVSYGAYLLSYERVTFRATWRTRKRR